MPLSVFQFVVMILAAARLTRVVTDDSISIPFRHWVEYKEMGKDGHVNIISLTTLLNCHWCTGWWVGLFVAGSTWAWGDGKWIWWLWIGLAISYTLGVVEDKLGSDS